MIGADVPPFAMPIRPATRIRAGGGTMLTIPCRFPAVVLYGGGNGRHGDRLAVQWHRDAGNSVISAPEFLYGRRSAD